jgi:hypothetical protein
VYNSFIVDSTCSGVYIVTHSGGQTAIPFGKQFPDSHALERTEHLLGKDGIRRQDRKEHGKGMMKILTREILSMILMCQ